MFVFEEVLNSFQIPIAILRENFEPVAENIRFKSSAFRAISINVLRSQRFRKNSGRFIQIFSQPHRTENYALIIGVRRIHINDGPHFLTMFSEPTSERPSMNELSGVQGDLTDAELSVVHGLLTGASLDTIAEARGTKVSTVRWHLKNIQAKLGVSHKHDVVSWVAQSPIRWMQP